METYKEFLDRINSFEKKEIHFGNKDFRGNPSISLKVDKDNSFKNYYGDTVVFALDDTIKNRLAEYTDILHRAVPQCFCTRLVPNTFHVTLHDLDNSPTLQDVAANVFNNELKIITMSREIRERKTSRIKLKSTYIFNMVDTSLVLGLRPADEHEYNKIMKLYSVIDSVKKLSYPFTPHITLAYYNVEGFDAKAASKLEDTVNRLNNDIALELYVDNLFYQKFTSMNDYIDIIDLSK